MKSTSEPSVFTQNRSFTAFRGVGRAASALLRAVGRAVGADHRDALDRTGSFESLEDRRLLEGSFATAIVVNLDPSGNGNSGGLINPAISSTNNDFYTFTTTSSDFVRVLADTANETPASTLNTRITVYGSQNISDVVASGTSNGFLTSGLQRDGWAGFVAEANHTYYVVVSSDYAGTQPNLPTGNTYTLRVATQSKSFDLWTETGIGIETGSPPPAPPLVPATPIVDRLDLRQQDMVYKFVAPSDASHNSLVTVNAQFSDYFPPTLPNSSIPDRMDTRLEIYSSTGQLISSDSDAGRINDAFTTFKATPGGTYFIRIRSDEVRPRQANNPAFDLSLATGPFYLVVDTAAQDITLNPVRRLGADPAGNFVSFGDPSTQPNPNIPAPTFQTHLYDFISQGDGLAFITVQPTGLAPVTDPAVRLFDSSGNLIGYNDNYAGLSAELQIRIVGGQKYFIVVDGFEINSAVQYTVNIEANYTFPDAVLDDHPNTPTTGTADQIRRQFNAASALVWGAPFATFDADGNVVRDRGLRVTATGTGRLFAPGDTDLFQFTPQVDMLINYDGNNDDNGTSLFMGGIFDTADPGTAWPVGSRNLSIWDANDYWFTGAQNFDPNFNVTYGFNDNADTAGTAGAEIYVLQDWDLDPTSQAPAGFTDHALVVGGDFDLVVPTPFGPQIIKNLAFWVQDFNTGRFGWAGIGDANGPVRAAAIYDPTPWDPDPDAPLPDDVLGPGLVLGGDFTDIGGSAVNRVTFISIDTGFAAAPFGAGIDNGSVQALAVYDPGFTIAERQANPGPPALDEVLGVRQTPSQGFLFIGGDFDLGGTDENFAMSFGLLTDPVKPGDVLVSPSRAPIDTSVDGVIHAFTVATFTVPDVESTDPNADPIDRPLLIAGGLFTQAGGVDRQNIAAFGMKDGVFDTQDPALNPFLRWNDITENDTGIANAEIFALTTWDPPDINNTTIDTVVVVGGDFNGFNGFNNLIGLDTFDGTDGGHGAWGWFSGGTGPQDIVRALTTVTDDQEPGIATDLLSGVPQTVLYVGGDFTTIDNGNPQPLRASHVAQYSAFHDPTFNVDFFDWSRMNNGVDNTSQTPPANATIFALSGFDDGNPLEWDRHDRRQTRLGVVVQGSDGSFINSRVRIFDSNFKLVYDFNKPGSETIAPPFPDPSGMIDESLAPGGDLQLEGIPVWGGETYYIEISDSTGTGTGRYTFTVTADALPTDLNGDGVLDDVNAVYVEEPDENQFTQATTVNTALGSGDGSNLVNSQNQPLHGNSLRQQKINPATGLRFTSASDLGNLETIDDTDLYLFRAQSTGFAEIRVATSLLGDNYAFTDGVAFTGLTRAGTGGGQVPDTATSLLDSAIRVFRNDFEQIAYNDDNPALTGEYEDMNIGALTPVRFFGRDARVVIPVIAGNIYYIQVESGAKFKDGSAGLAEDRVPNVAREIDMRQATGAYQLFVNAMPQLDNDVENGNTVQDDHFDASFNNPANFNLATPIDIGDIFDDGANGTGSVTGIINNTPLKLSDADSFIFIAPGSGQMRITLSRTTGSNLTANIALFEIRAGVPVGVANGNPTSNGGQQIIINASKGTQYGLVVIGTGGSEGGYRVDISGIPEVDDYADFAKFADAQDITLRDFLGQGNISGSIESPGDNDLFRFAFPDFFSSLTITVTGLDTTLNPTVTIYEISEDPAANPIMLRIAFNDDVAAGTTTARVLFPVSPSREKAGPPARDYPYYYVLVQDANPQGGFGRYTVSVSFPPTDDHPDGDTDLDGVLDTGEFSFATGVVIDSNTGLGGNSGLIEIDTDSDLFKFGAPAGGTANVSIFRPASSTLHTHLSILDANGTLITEAFGADATGDETITASFTVVRNTVYYIVVQGFDDINAPNTVTTLNGAYTLNIATPPIDDHPNADEWALADTVFFNTSTGVAQLGGTEANDPANSRLAPSGDTDLLTFTALIAGTQTITLSPFNAGGGFVPQLTIFDANRTQIGQVTGTTPLQQLSFVVSAPTAGTRFYILVTAVNTGSDPLTGEYGLRIVGPVPTGEAGGPDPSVIDFNNPINIPINATTGYGSMFDVINPAGDRDLFTFTTYAAGKVFVQIVTPDGSTLDASIQVQNAANENVGALTAFNADGIPGTTASVSFDSAASRQYWVIVDGLGDSTGSYQIRVQVQPFTNVLYFPEGFANNNIREFVSIVNPNSVDANYTVYLRYEFGSQLETIVANGLVRAHSRDGLTLKDGGAYTTPGLLLDTPYSIIVQSDQPLGATLAHYDFGNAVGDTFSNRTSASWYFARVERNPGSAKDYIVFYNPNNFDVTVTMTAQQNGQEQSLTRTFGALRRGGFSIDDVTDFPIGTFGVRLSAVAANSANNSAFVGIVASISHYTPGGAAGWATMGDPDGGAKAGAITNITQGSKVNSEVTFYNPGLTTVTVTLTGTYVRETLPSFVRTFDVAPRSQVKFTGTQLGLVADQPAGLTWRSNSNIVANSNQQQQGDADSTSPATVAGTQFRFGDAFIESSQAGRLYFETLYIYNPTALTNNVSVNLVFLDGTTATFTTTVRARGFAEVKLHERPEIVVQRTGPQWFGVDLSSALPFAVSMVHYDLAINGGWATAGSPFGLTNPLSRIS